MAAPQDRIALMPEAFRLAQELLGLGAEKKPIDFEGDRSHLKELVRKGVVESIGGGRGKAGKLKLLVKPNDITQSTRKPRGGGTPAASKARVRLAGPTLEELESLVKFVRAEETKLRQSESKRIKEQIVDLKKSLMAETDEAEESRIIDDLQTLREKSKNIQQTIRESAIRAASNSDEAFAKHAHLLSNKVG